ncbi:MAG: acyl-CoA dehydrogenase family protein [Nocardiopsaceae bacterium]|nr:acyl-CoA dehydrogenase family protein [Nocardiopsaceae bacterium]
MDFSLTPEQVELQGVARRFAYTELWPAAQELDKAARPRDAFPADLVKRASELGLRTLKLPREYGGRGIDAVTEALVLEEIAVGDCGFAMTLAHAWREGNLIARWGTRDQRERFLPELASDPGYLTSLAMTEPHAGSDNGLPYDGDLGAGPRTSAVLDGDHWVINGTKRFITNGNVARLIVLWARTDPGKPWTRGTSGFLVPADAPGLRVGRTEDKSGLRLNQNVELIFDDCRIPKENLIGELHHAHALSEEAMIGSKTKEAVRALGVARSAYELAGQWATERIQGGSPLIQHEAIAARMAQVLQELETARTLIWRAAWSVDHDPERARPLEDMAMLYTSEMGIRVAAQCLRIFGARGSLRDWPMEKLMRDASTIMLPPIGNEASWARVGNFVARHPEPAPLHGPRDPGPRDPGLRLPFTPPE